MKRLEDNSSRVRSHFMEMYNQYLNEANSSTYSAVKDRILTLKNQLLEELIKELIEKIEALINENYNGYIDYLILLLKNILPLINNDFNTMLTFNEQDFNYFNKNPNILKNVIKSNMQMQKAEEEFIGGLKIVVSDQKISYDYTITNEIAKNKAFIEKEFSNHFHEQEITIIEKEFEDFISNQKKNVEELLKEYDRI